jgi:hypothetical protein
MILVWLVEKIRWHVQVWIGRFQRWQYLARNPTPGPYRELFPKGSRVRVVGVEKLQAFAQSWKYHNPVQPETLAFAGKIAKVKSVGYYHGGDVLYELSGFPGAWHKACVESINPRP